MSKLEDNDCSGSKLDIVEQKKPFVRPTCLIILYPRTTTGGLVDALNSTMGGPARNKIPDDDMVNTMLNLLSY